MTRHDHFQGHGHKNHLVIMLVDHVNPPAAVVVRVCANKFLCALRHRRLHDTIGRCYNFNSNRTHSQCCETSADSHSTRRHAGQFDSIARELDLRATLGYVGYWEPFADCGVSRGAVPAKIVTKMQSRNEVRPTWPMWTR